MGVGSFLYIISIYNFNRDFRVNNLFFYTGVGHLYRTDERAVLHADNSASIGGHQSHQKLKAFGAFLAGGQYHYVRGTWHCTLVHIHRPAAYKFETINR